MKLKKLSMVITITMMATVLVSCGKKKEEPVVEVTPVPTQVVEVATPTPTPTEIPKDMVVSYLTGELVPEKAGRRRPIAVMMNNVKVATPQAGIANAGVVYEVPVEGSITRLMAVIEDYDNLEKIGSMRSCRNYFIFYASGFDAIYAHYGQAVYAEGLLALPEVNNLSGLAGYGSSVYYRTSDRKAPHNAYTSYDGIQRGIEICDYNQEYRDGYQSSYKFANDGEAVDLPGDWEAKVVKPGYLLNDASFEYNEEDGLYYRFQYGGKQIDELTNEQLTYKNILIQYSTWRNFDQNGYLDIDVDAANSGIYITDGKAIEVTWKKNEPWGPTYYYDKNGEQITMNRGKTWVCIVLDTMKDRVAIEDDKGNATSSTGTTAGDAPQVIAPEAIAP